MSARCTSTSLYDQSRRVLTPPRPVLKTVILALAAICLSFSSRAGAQNDEQPLIKVEPKSRVFLAYGDIRFTDPSRCDVSNVRARTELVERMAGLQEIPDFIVMTGDIVYNGDDKNDWTVFDEETKPLRERHVRLFPVLGNHDVHGPSGRHNFVNHFDELKTHRQLETRTWYALDYGNAHFIMLDSQTTYESRTPQGEWLRSQLKSVRDDLDFLFVVLHHPLVTHPSRLPVISRCDGNLPKPQLAHDVEDAEKRLRIILQEFSQTHPNIRIFVLSGHNHNYERYSVKGITYVVTAGGGATPYKVIRRNTDAYRESGPTYHYCRIAITAHVLQFQMYKLILSGTVPEWELKDSFRLAAVAGRQIAVRDEQEKREPSAYNLRQFCLFCCTTCAFQPILSYKSKHQEYASDARCTSSSSKMKRKWRGSSSEGSRRRTIASRWHLMEEQDLNSPSRTSSMPLFSISCSRLWMDTRWPGGCESRTIPFRFLY
jgi:hypothetical protein